jgi:TolC family type I secretion outer membrane protein
LAARAGQRATDEGVPQALSGWRPTVQGNTSYGKRFRDTELLPSRGLSPFNTGLTVAQPLFRGGRTVAGTRRAEKLVLAGREQLKATEQGVLLAAVTAYMDVFRDQAVVELTSNNERVLRRQLEATEERFKVGDLTRTDVAQSQARLSRASSDRISAEGDLIASQATFTRVIGVAPQALEAPDPISDLPDSEEGAQAVAEDENPNLRAADFNEGAARHAIRESTGSLLPTVSLNAALSRNRDAAATTNRTDNAEITAQLTIPLFQAGAVWSQARQARQTHSQARLQVDDSRRGVVEGVTRAWQALQTARARIESDTDEVLANEIALEGVRAEATVGERTILDILDAEQELLDARVNLVRSERDELVAAFTLMNAIGRLTAAQLDLPVEVYDPTLHYEAVRYKWFGFGKPTE